MEYLVFAVLDGSSVNWIWREAAVSIFFVRGRDLVRSLHSANNLLLRISKRLVYGGEGGGLT